MKLTPEQDARLCAEYGVTPGELELGGSSVTRTIYGDGRIIAKFPTIVNDDEWETGSVFVARVAQERESWARLMAASKPMVALLERALSENMQHPSNTLAADIRALLDGLKGTPNEQD